MAMKQPDLKNESEAEVPLETMITELEKIVAELENNELSLEHSLALFERGVLLTRKGQIQLDQAQQRVDILLAEHIEKKEIQAPLTPYQNE